MNDIMKIVNSLEESGLLIKDVIEKIQNEEKERKVSLVSKIIGCISASAFASLLGTTSSAIGLKVCAIAAGIKKYKSIIKKKKKET